MGSFAGDKRLHERFNEFIQYSHKHKRMNLSEKMFELRNDATRSRHLSRKRKQESEVDSWSTDELVSKNN